MQFPFDPDPSGQKPSIAIPYKRAVRNKPAIVSSGLHLLKWIFSRWNMLSQDNLYSEMDQVLDMLLQTTRQLKEVAKHAIEETELDLLQQKQQELLGKAVELDKHLKQSEIPPKTFAEKRQKIH